MDFIHNKKAKVRTNFLICLSIAIIVYMTAFCFAPFVSYALSPKNSKVVRVGFFEFEGYHEKDEQQRRSGYGYEYLHEMAKYTGWSFEYVDGTWEECQEMLKNGEIDILTSAQYSKKRDELFDFSSTSMGTSYAQITVLAGNTTYGRNDFLLFDGIHIGLLKGNSRNDSLAKFALEKGFSYTDTLYETQAALDTALKTGEVDAVLTSSLRKLKDESIIAQYDPAPFYAMVKEGNSDLLREINLSLEAIEMNSPAFRYNLYQEFYRIDTTDTFILSREEKEYLETKPAIRAVISPEIAPLSYWENDNFQGISADIIKYIFSDLDIEVEFVCPSSLKESYEMLADGSVDIACLFESDYNIAEQYNTHITTPYITTNYSMISRQQHNQSIKSNQIIAVPDGGLNGIKYLQEHYPNAQYILSSSSSAAIKSVNDGKADMAFVNVYSAEKEITSYPNLKASFISEDEQQFSIGVSQTADSRLYSILDKKINSLDSHVLNDTLSKYTMFQQVPMNLSVYFRYHPMALILICIVFFTIIISVLLYIIMSNRRHAKNIYNLAYVDTMTKLWNLNGFILQGKRLLTKNLKASYAVAAVDLSNFSGINEDYGRKIGDAVIRDMGKILKEFNDEHTIVAHTEADHFVMLVSYDEMEDLNIILEKISHMLCNLKINDLPIKFNINIGVGFVVRQYDDLLQAMDHAGIARNGCSQNKPITYMDKTLQDNLLREKDIRDNVETALNSGEFLVYFQPKVDMTTRKIIGAEALIRWEHSKLGLLSPAEFLPIIEQNGLVTEVDFFVLEEVCKLIRKWIDTNQEPVVISVNQSRIHFLKSNYLERLQNMIDKYNIPAGHIELEITETLFGQEAISNTIIKKIKEIGLLISIDDFGSGYSSLHLLHQISVDILKIDKGLLDESDKEEKMRNIIRRVVQIARDLDVDVICEGVETKEQVEFLLGADCKYAQGFLFSKPLPQPEFEMLIKSGMIIKEKENLN